MSFATDKEVEEARKLKGKWTRELIIKWVNQFFQDSWNRHDYWQPDDDINDPYCDLTEDLLYNTLNRVEFFEYLEDIFDMHIQNRFVFNASRLSQVYDYLERRLIKEGGREIPRKIRQPVEEAPQKRATAAPQKRAVPAGPYKGPKIAFLFPGQGAQKLGMAKELVPAAKKLFEKAEEILGYDLLGICNNGPESKLNSTAVSQPAIFVTSLAALEKLKIDNPEAYNNSSCTAGLSLGEYTALVFAGVLSFEDALKIVKVRGEAMQEAADKVKSGMVSALGLELNEVEDIVKQAAVKGQVEIANYLCPRNYVVSGEESGLAEVERLIKEKKKITKRIAVAGAFHTNFMKPAADKLKEVLDTVEFKSPRIPVITNVDGKIYKDPVKIKENLINQLTSPVKWEQSMINLLNDGYLKVYEIGVGAVLVGLMRHIFKTRNPPHAELFNLHISG